MRLAYSIPCLFLLLMATMPLRAQWKPGFDMSGGVGWIPGGSVEDNEYGLFNHYGQASGNISYTAPRLKWNATLGGNYRMARSDSWRYDYVHVNDDDPGIKSAYKISAERPLNVNFNSSANWTPKPGLRIEPRINYNYFQRLAVNYTYNGDYTGKNPKETHHFETPEESRHGVSGGARLFHDLGSGFALIGELSLGYRHQDKSTQWIIAPDVDISVDSLPSLAYRIFQKSNIQNLVASVHLRDTVIRKPGTFLMYDTGVRLSEDYAMDRNSGATLDIIDGKEVWRDSLALKETFDFLQFRAEPYLQGDFTYGRLQAHADYALHVYSQRLSDSLHKGGFNKPGFYPVGNGSVTWRFSDHHRLSFGNQLTVSHPSYQQVCWFVRPDKYVNQRIMGNPSLRSTRTERYSLGYNFDYGRFHSATTVFFRRIVGEVERTWFEDVDDGITYKVFTWVNGADSRALGGSQSLSWTGKVFKSHIHLDYSGNRRQMRESGEVRKSFDWRLSGDASLDLGRGWTASVDATYTSKVKTFFSIFSQYCALNANIQKKFRNGLAIYLRGRDLLDKVTTNEFFSADGNQAWMEEIRKNRRQLILGISWNL